MPGRNEKQISMSDKRILFISEEIAPYVPGRELADFSRKLAENAHSQKYEVRTFMPKYGTVNERRNQLHEVIRLSGANIPIGDNDHPLIIKVASLQPFRIQVYFIDNEDYFQKLDDDEDPIGSNRADNDERAIFFARGTMETVKKLRWVPKVIFCTGWFAALTPIYLRSMYADDPSFKGAKIVYCVTPSRATGGIDAAILDKMQKEGMPKKKLEPFRSLPADTDMLHRMAIACADAVVVADPAMSDDLRSFIAERKLPTLEFTVGDNVSAVFDFYKSLIPDEK